MNFIKFLKAIKADLETFADSEKAELEGAVIIVLSVMVAAILTGALGPISLSQMVNATAAGGLLANASSSVQNTWNAIPTMFSVALLMIPIALVSKFMR